MMGKYHAYIFASTKRLGHFHKRLTTRSDWAITAALNLLWEKSTVEAPCSATFAWPRLGMPGASSGDEVALDVEGGGVDGQKSSG
jgi:hypothetical protein